MSKPKKPASYSAKALAALTALEKQSVQAFDDIHEGVRITTGFPSFDTILGGGILEGRQVLFWGGESSGKTTLALQCLKYSLTVGRFGLLLDYERTIMESHVAALTGVEVVQLKHAKEWLAEHGAKHPPVVFFTQPANVEEATDLVRGMSIAFESAMAWVLLDSIPAAMPDAMIEADASQHFIGKQALVLTSFLNIMQAVLPRHRTTLALITQERANIITKGFAGSAPEVKPAGPYAMRFTVSQRIRLTKGEGHAHKSLFGAASHAAYVTVEKNKTSSDRRGKTRLSLRPGKGFSRAADVLDLAVQYGVVRDGGPGLLIMPNGTKATKTDVMGLIDHEQGPAFFDSLAKLVVTIAGKEGPVLDIASKKDAE